MALVDLVEGAAERPRTGRPIQDVDPARPHGHLLQRDVRVRAKHVLHGPFNQEAVEMAHGHSLEISFREIVAMSPLMVLMLVIGVFPAWIVGVINATVTRLLS